MAAVLREPPRGRLSIALGAAALLHAACAFFGYRTVRSHASFAHDVAPQGGPEIEFFDVGLDVGAVTNDVETAGSDELPRQVAIAAAMSAHREERRSSRAPSDRRDPPEPSRAASAGESGGAESALPEQGYALDPSAAASGGRTNPAPSVQLGIGAGDWSRFVDPLATPRVDTTRRPSRPSELAPPVSSTGGLAEALEAHDQKVGLGPAGAVLSAVHEAGYSEVAPALGSATFSITVLRSGAIDVALTGVTSQRDAWTKVGDRIVAAIRKKPPRIPASRNGVRLGIEVVAEERWPNGQIARLDHGPKIAVAAPKVQAVDEAKEALLDRNPTAVPDPDAPGGKTALKANVEMPGIFVEGRGKVCSYRVGLSPTFFSGGCDPSNIGQPARRVVSTRIVNQSML